MELLLQLLITPARIGIRKNTADRPNPLGLHRVKVLQITDNKLKVGSLEAIDVTPVMDIKPVL